jgi:hypothetical protein
MSRRSLLCHPLLWNELGAECVLPTLKAANTVAVETAFPLQETINSLLAAAKTKNSANHASFRF